MILMSRALTAAPLCSSHCGVARALIFVNDRLGHDVLCCRSALQAARSCRRKRIDRGGTYAVDARRENGATLTSGIAHGATVEIRPTVEDRPERPLSGSNRAGGWHRRRQASDSREALREGNRASQKMVKFAAES